MFDIKQLLASPGLNRLLQPLMMGGVQGMQPPNMLAGAGQMQAPVPPVPVASQPQKPSFMDRYNAFTESDRGRTLNDFFLGLAMGSTPNQSLAGAAQMVATGRSERAGKKNQNQTVEWLMGQGMSPEEAQMVASQPNVLSEFLKQRMKGGQQSEYEQRAAAAQQYGLDPESPEGQAYILSGKLPESRGGAAELGLNPQYGVDDQGNPVLIQIGKDGKAVQTAMPEGVSLSKEPIKLDAGTHWVLLDPITRQPVGQVSKEIAEAESQKALGKAQGELTATLPSDMLSSTQTVAQIDELLRNPGLDAIVGPLDQFRPSWTMGDQGRDALARYNQLKGRAFLQAYSMLKGGGQITEVEGKKAEDAMARMDRAQDEATFRQALQDFRDAVQEGQRKLLEKAGIPNDQWGQYMPGIAPQGGSKRLKFNPATGALE